MVERAIPAYGLDFLRANPHWRGSVNRADFHLRSFFRYFLNKGMGHGEASHDQDQAAQHR